MAPLAFGCLDHAVHGPTETRADRYVAPVEAVTFDTRWARAFRRRGFAGWTALGDAVEDRRKWLADNQATLAAPGVYAMFAPPDWASRFKTTGLTNVIEPWSLAKLRARWIDDVELVYIGCAGRTPTSRSLAQRLDDLLRHGSGRITTRGPHKGGESLWQCHGWETFTLAWKQTGSYPEPHKLEVAIGERFVKLAGGLPFRERLTLNASEPRPGPETGSTERHHSGARLWTSPPHQQRKQDQKPEIWLYCIVG